MFYHEQYKYSEAKELYDKSLAIERRVLGDVHIDVAVSLHNLAALYRDYGDFLKSLVKARETGSSEYNKFINTYSYLIDSESIDIKASYDHLLNEAEKHFRESLKIKRSVYGEDHPSIAITLRGMAALYSIRERDDEAEIYYKKALAMLEKFFDKSHSKIRILQEDLKELYK